MNAPRMDAVTRPDDAFEFGANWRKFLETVDESRIANARQSLVDMLGRESMAGMTFLDAGCGSGLFSLAASRLGASVVSFDVDPNSVSCTEEIKRRFGNSAASWTIQTGSLLDNAYLSKLGTFDNVYCWGVAHHSGDMRTAIDNLLGRVAHGGRIWLAIYNDQGLTSRVWGLIKQIYSRLPALLKTPYVVVIGGVWGAWRVILKLYAKLAALVLGPFLPAPSELAKTRVSSQSRSRGMHPWYDLVDWIGGWPFEVAKPEDMLHLVRPRGFELREMTTCGGKLGCNEFVFERTA